MATCIVKWQHSFKRRRRFLLVVVTSLTLASAQLSGETIEIDNFDDGILDGWTVEDVTQIIGQPWGPGHGSGIKHQRRTYSCQWKPHSQSSHGKGTRDSYVGCFRRRPKLLERIV